jgi:hypothetical protein
VRLGEEEATVVSCGFKGTALEGIKEAARDDHNAAGRQMISSRLAQGGVRLSEVPVSGGSARR